MNNKRLELWEVSAENVVHACRLVVKTHQERFVEPVAESLAGPTRNRRPRGPDGSTAVTSSSGSLWAPSTATRRSGFSAAESGGSTSQHRRNEAVSVGSRSKHCFSEARRRGFDEVTVLWKPGE